MGSFCLNTTSFDYDSNINCNITSSSEFNDVWTMRLESDGRIKLNLGSSRKVNLKVYSVNGSAGYNG